VDPIELVAVGAWAFVVSVIGRLAGLVLDNLRLPVVLLFASTPAASSLADGGRPRRADRRSTANH
jgi:hypothetical protein